MKRREDRRRSVLIKQGAALALCLLAAWVFCCVPVGAAAPAIHSIDITVELEQNGDAWVTEVWDVTTTSGTEFYITKHNLDKQKIWRLSVSDEKGLEYQDVGPWDSGWTQEYKADKCGLLETNGGYEICWGLGGEYGRHVYTVRYRMNSIVKGYKGADALNQRFVSSELFARAKAVRINIRSAGAELAQSNTRMWAFGFEGDIYLQDGEVKVSTSGQLWEQDHVTVLLAFEEGMFQPEDVRTRKFERVLQQATRGSDYKTTDWQTIVLRIGMILPLALLLGILLTWAARHILLAARFARKPWRKGRIPLKYRRAPYCRRLPYGGNLPAAFAQLCKLGGEYGYDSANILGAYLLKWLCEQHVGIVMRPDVSGKETVYIRLFENAAEGLPPLEQELYKMLLGAAGDALLQPEELEKMAQHGGNGKIEMWFAAAKLEGQKNLQRENAISQKRKGGLWRRGVKINVATPRGEELTREMFGFWRYLEDFTIINERGAREVELWDSYLVYAQLFGIADKVEKQFNELYPAYFEQLSRRIGLEGRRSQIGAVSVTREFYVSASRGHYGAVRASAKATLMRGIRTSAGGRSSGYGGRFSGGGGGSSRGGGGGSSGSGSRGGGTR